MFHGQTGDALHRSVFTAAQQEALRVEIKEALRSKIFPNQGNAVTKQVCSKAQLNPSKKLFDPEDEVAAEQKLFESATENLAAEDPAIAEALRQEEAEQRARLREEQQAEYEESLRIDRQRAIEETLRKKEEEERQRREAEEMESARQQAEAKERARQDKIAEVLEEAKKLLPPEPPQDEANKLTFMIKTPDGRRLKRTFRAQDTIGQVYAFAQVEGGEALTSQEFLLVENMPRRVYEDRSKTLAAAGLKGQCALLVEMIDDDEDEHEHDEEQQENKVAEEDFRRK